MTVRELPSVDALVAALDAPPLPRALVVEVARHALDSARAARRDGEPADPAALAEAELASLRTVRPGRVINATGVLLNTNLGRAPLAPAAAEAGAVAGAHYGAVEFDLTTGARGGRGRYVAELLRALVPAEAALVVNNNAGGLFLALATLAGGGGVVVARGELIEIGGSFRLPELMAASGATLIEVGTTNRTRLSDYEAVIDRAAMILKVHPSNYRVEGFTAEASYAELAALARSARVPLVADIGSGLLDASVPWLPGPPPAWLVDEPAAVQTLEAGAAVVLFSGDKLLGGPQAGIAVGDAAPIRAMARHPIGRAVRTDGATLAALGATLEMYADGRGADVPFWAMASRPAAQLRDRASDVLAASGCPGEVADGHSLPGAGSVPGQQLPSPVIHITASPDAVWRRLLRADPPVIARRDRGALVVDLRAVDPADDDRLAAALAAACQ